MKRILLTFTLAAFLNPLFAQNKKCGTATKAQQLLLAHPELSQQRAEIEANIQDYIKNNPQAKGSRATYTIPVVVHVIHNGEAIGTGVNISDAQINSQMTVLNKDFRKLNTDWTNTPTAFQSLVADCELEFCLAKVNPSGTTTTGIDRVNGGQNGWDDITFDSQIKPSTIWDNTKYLNIWICKFDNTMSGLLGYTATPFFGFPANQDGVVIDYHYFGTTGTVTSPLNKGRTATHEIGHYFNLEHIWGDDNGACSGSDNVSDTPNQGSENYGCPTFPSVSCSNGPNGDLFMNYMDYVDDACMVMFTAGQKTRMRAAISTYRPALILSKACFPLAVSDVKATENSISIFPNPSSNYFYIGSNNGNFDSNFKISILNSLGQEITDLTIIEKESQSRYVVNASNLANGTYFIKMTTNSQQISKTISILK